uniref:Uncharacterized protein n=1 Tax=Oryza brachyantha TaxID=4533 RepID=J3MP85_ORYBR
GCGTAKNQLHLCSLFFKSSSVNSALKKLKSVPFSTTLTPVKLELRALVTDILVNVLNEKNRFTDGNAHHLLQTNPHEICTNGQSVERKFIESVHVTIDIFIDTMIQSF